MSKRVLITGSEGFTGKYVCDEFRRAGWEVWGAGLQPKPDDAQYLQIDLLNPDTLKPIADKIKPDVVIHLAAIAFVAEKDPNIFYQVNLVGTRHLLEVLANAKNPPECTILASSANVYGNSDLEVLSEDSPVNPVNDYAVSKLAMEYMAKIYMDRLPITITRPFNYTGVGQSERFLIPKIVSHFARKADVIELGNLNVARDFSDVRNIAKHYLRLPQESSQHSLLNLCSGKATSIRSILLALENLSGHRLEIRTRSDLLRNNEVKKLCGCNKKLISTGSQEGFWEFEDTLRWMLESARCWVAPGFF